MGHHRTNEYAEVFQWLLTNALVYATQRRLCTHTDIRVKYLCGIAILPYTKLISNLRVHCLYFYRKIVIISVPGQEYRIGLAVNNE